jgi:hypothetical protein
MKALLSSRAILLAVFAAAVAIRLSATPAGKPALSHPVTAVERSDERLICNESMSSDVLRLLGFPARKIGTDLWIYRNYRPAGTDATDDCHILFITLRDKRVVAMQLVNEPAEKILIARAEARPSEKNRQAAE